MTEGMAGLAPVRGGMKARFLRPANTCPVARRQPAAWDDGGVPLRRRCRRFPRVIHHQHLALVRARRRPVEANGDRAAGETRTSRRRSAPGDGGRLTAKSRGVGDRATGALPALEGDEVPERRRRSEQANTAGRHCSQEPLENGIGIHRPGLARGRRADQRKRVHRGETRAQGAVGLPVADERVGVAESKAHPGGATPPRSVVAAGIERVRRRIPEIGCRSPHVVSDVSNGEWCPRDPKRAQRSRDGSSREPTGAPSGSDDAGASCARRRGRQPR